MEHVENDLKRFMDVRKQPLNLNQVKCIMKQFLEGVRFLYENGLMHRDLKPTNILINRKGDLKICDFGCIMAELLLKEVLFKGRCDLEQIAQIYIILGSGEPDDNRLMHKFLATASSAGAPSLTELGFDLLKKVFGV
ncbi:UNVERIFIED_CONTAM: Cyclin-dependent kinase G1 [Sesamum latifolium]|uniref:Cyclin-dependent kinase G1 n=1 Tax=Sesamum latifolium TaxID=2727402 RepID=A0AAW2WS62_9LAMI